MTWQKHCAISSALKGQGHDFFLIEYLSGVRLLVEMSKWEYWWSIKASSLVHSQPILPFIYKLAHFSNCICHAAYVHIKRLQNETLAIYRSRTSIYSNIILYMTLPFKYHWALNKYYICFYGCNCTLLIQSLDILYCFQIKLYTVESQ